MIRKKGFAPRYINFLRQICGSYERPMPNNQVGGVRMCGEICACLGGNHMALADITKVQSYLELFSQQHAVPSFLRCSCHDQELDGVYPTIRQTIVLDAVTSIERTGLFRPEIYL